MSDRSLMSGVLALGAAVALMGAPASLRAQDWRTVSSVRARGSESALAVKVQYGAGKLGIQPTGGGELYRVDIRYDSELFDPVTDYKAGNLEVGVEGTGHGVRLKNHRGGEMKLGLSPDIPLDLNLDFGAVEANLDLGGLRVQAVDIETGASDTELVFSRPNPIDCTTLSISVGAAAFSAVGLANSRCQNLDVEGGVGDVKLDFTGDWDRDMAADVTLALGSMTLVVPEDIGVQVEKDTFLTGFDSNGFTKLNGMYRSQNWEVARRHLVVKLEGAFGSVDVRWAGATLGSTP